MSLSHPLVFCGHAFFLPLMLCGLVGSALAIEPANVLVLYNADDGPDGSGFQIASYYQQVRPGVHVAPITGVNAINSGGFGEDVSGQDYLAVIRPQILNAIGAIPDSIEVIVTTKGMPLRIDAGTKPPGGPSNWKRFSSLESELTRIDSISTLNKMGDQYFNAAFPQIDFSLASNPYYNDNVPFVRAGSDPFNGDIRLASRLDGYSVEKVKAAIDRAQRVYIVPFEQYIILDDTGFASVDQMTNGFGPGPGAFEVITTLYPDDGITNPVPVLYNQTNTAVVSSSRPVIGYVSHGTNDGSTFGLNDNYLGELVGGQFQPGQVQFTFANGAVFQTHESFNAQSFHPANTQTQGLIADWLEVGGTAGLGHVAEPGNGHENVTNEDLFYQMLLPALGAAAAPGESGLTFIEAAWNATRQLSYVNTVVGDPLMRFQAWVPGDTNLDGIVEFNDFFTMEGNWNQLGTRADGDSNGDGLVNEDDFALLQQNWLTAPGLLASMASEIQVSPILDEVTGWPKLSATLMRPANFNQDLNVDGADLELLWNSYGVDAGGDLNGDGVTDGADFLIWQQQYFVYTYTADFDIDADVGSNDLQIWENSYRKNRGGDSDGNGVTDGFDFLAWQREVALPAPGIVATQAVVPEPATACYVFVSVAAFLARGRRRG